MSLKRWCQCAPLKTGDVWCRLTWSLLFSSLWLNVVRMESESLQAPGKHLVYSVHGCFHRHLRLLRSAQCWMHWRGSRSTEVSSSSAPVPLRVCWVEGRLLCLVSGCVLCTSSSVSRHYFRFSCVGIHAVIAEEHWQVRTGAEGWWLMIKHALYIQFNPANNFLIPNTQYSPMKCLWPDASWNRNTAINLKIT